MRIFIAIFLCFFSCIEPYEFSNLDEDNLYVVDGYISDEEKPHLIKVMKTIRFSNEGNPGVENAAVNIIVDNEFKERLISIGNGYYRTNPAFKAEPDHSYQLQVITPDQKVIYSDEMFLQQEQGDIESITYDTKIINELNAEGEEVQQKNVSFFLLMNVKNNHTFYKWEINTSWKAKAKLSYQICYVENFKESDIIIWHNKENFSEEKVLKIPLADIEFSHQMQHDYRFSLTQYSIGEEAYLFWNQVKMQQESQGSMFDPIAGSITGNLHLEDSDERVLGFFGVYAKKQHVIHLNQTDLPFKVIPIDCTPEVGDAPLTCSSCMYNYGKNVTSEKPEDW